MKGRIKEIVQSIPKMIEARDIECIKTVLVTWFLLITASVELLSTSYGITLTQQTIIKS